MATPSLAMIPSAYADSKVYSVLPNNGDGDFTFNRDSSATRVGQNGLIQEVGYFGSEETTNGSFTGSATGWTLSGSVAYNNNALDSNAGGSATQSGILTSGKNYKINIVISAFTSGVMRVKLGTATSSTFTETTTVYVTSNGTDFILDLLGSFVGTIDSVSVVEVTGDQPRLNYDISNGVVQSCPSLLLEPQRTNTALTKDFSNSIWTKINITIASGFTSPDGTNNAYEITDNSTNNNHVTYDGELSPTDGNVYTRSVFVKKGTARYVVLSARHLPTSSGTSWIYDFNINNWVLTGSSGAGQSIEDYGNGWIRLSISHISNSNLNNDFSIGISSGATVSDASYSGVGDTLYIYGAQVELGSYPTSYIPTNGSSQTRAAETCFGAGTSSTFNSTEGVIYLEASALALAGGDSRISLSDGTLNNRISFAYSPTASKAYIIVKINGVSVINNLNVEIGNHLDIKKIAISYKSGDTKVYLNGVELLTSSVSFSGGVLNDLSFESANSSVKFYGNTKDIRVYNEALTDAQLQTLTQV